MVAVKDQWDEEAIDIFNEQCADLQKRLAEMAEAFHKDHQMCAQTCFYPCCRETCFAFWNVLAMSIR